MSLPPLTIIPAGAGSGKTYRIQETLTKWVREGRVAPDRIAAVTFTEAAASELKTRIREALMADSRLDIEQTLALDQAYITTLHGFGLRIIEEYCFEGGWSPLPRKLSDEEADILIRQTLAATDKADTVMDDLKQYGYQWDYNNGAAEDQLRAQISKMINQHRVIGCEGNSPKLKHALVSHIKTGYGKTRIAETLEKNLRTAIVAMLRAFPDPLEGLYPGNKSFVSTLKSDYRNLNLARSPNALKSDWPLWKSLQDLRQSRRGSALPEKYDDLAQAVMNAAQQLYRHPGPRDQAITHISALADAAQESLEKHAQLKKEKGLVDYGDMLGLANHLLCQNPDVLKDLASRIDCVVIDEFQDTNPLQFSLMWALRQQGIPTLVVGDIKQAIMGFQDADSRLLSALAEKRPDACAPLDRNWRTTKVLMNFLNETSAKLFGSDYQHLIPSADFESKLDPLRVINFKYTKSQDFYARHTAAEIKKVLETKTPKAWDSSIKAYRPVHGSDIAVLLPTNALIPKYAQALIDLGYQVQVDESGWSASRGVQLAYHALSYVADPADRHAALYLATTELGESSLEYALKQLIKGEHLDDPVLTRLVSLQNQQEHLDASSYVNATLEALDLFGIISKWPDAGQERANILRLLGEADSFTNTNPETLEAAGLHGTGPKTFLAWLNTRFREDDSLPKELVLNEQAIQLTTWHKSKGREWPIVAVCGTYKEYGPRLPNLGTHYEDFSDLGKILEKARLRYSPNFSADETNDAFLEPLAAESEQNARRLLYVAMTRAREMLILERCGFTEEKDKNNYWNLLFDAISPQIENGKITICNKCFPCKQVTIEKSEPTAFEQPVKVSQPASILAIGRRVIIPVKKKIQLTPDTLNPSLMPNTNAPDDLVFKTIQYGEPLDINIDRTPTEVGTILHRCLEILTTEDDRTHLLESGTGYQFTDQEKYTLQKAVTTFEKWLDNSLGAIKLHKEVPISYENAFGSIVNGTIDLLVETKDGYWIFDHKTSKTVHTTGILNFLDQLLAYENGLSKRIIGKPILGFGIHWISASEVSYTTK